jgi:hypothetical protein
MATSTNFFRNMQTQDAETAFDTQQFLLAVEAQFKSPEVHNEVRWRLQVLKELAGRVELEDVSRGLRKALSRIFATLTDEQKILAELKDLTEVEGGADGKPVDLRRFLKRDRRTFDAEEYARILRKKIGNTLTQVQNLILFFPDSQKLLTGLARTLNSLLTRIRSGSEDIQSVKASEDKLRETPEFQQYEKLKEEFLKKWLERFSSLSAAEIAKLPREEIQRLVVEHQRHQLTALLKTQVKASSIDMSEHLDPHDTLETEFKDQEFWKGSNNPARLGFREWILAVIQAFGMLKGQRYALFENNKDPNQLLLFGIGVAGISDEKEPMLTMVPFIKPFTRKGGYLLEVRNRELGEPNEYYMELRHYVLPFLFGFDAMREFKLPPDLFSFFKSNY